MTNQRTDRKLTADDMVLAFERAQRQQNRDKRVRTATFGMLFALAVVGSAWVSEVSVGKFVEGLPGLVAYVRGTLPVLRADSLVADMAEWYWGIGHWLRLLGDTLLIAFMGTLLGSIGAFSFCFPASRNLMTCRWLYIICRRLMEVARTVPELVFALIFVYAFGLGPLPGVLAIAVHSMGALGKLFAEVNENIDPCPLEGVRAAGGNWWQIIRYAVVPQVLPKLTSYTMLRFEINVRASSVVGFVGAGGIGLQLADRIRVNNWNEVGFLLVMILITVSCIDMLSKTIRSQLIEANRSRMPAQTDEL